MKKKNLTDPQFRVVKTAGYKFSKRAQNTNKKAGLHDKKKNLAEGESRVNRRKPLALKHVRRMRKAAVVLSCVFVVAVGAIGAGMFLGDEGTSYTGFKTVCYELPDPKLEPTNYTLVETVGFMNYVLQNQPYWSSSMYSDVNAMGFQQHVETYKQFYDGILISCDVAKGFSNKGTQYCVNAEKGIILWRPAVGNLDGMNSEWSETNISKTDFEKFIEWRGFPPNEFSVYVLNEKTISNAEEYSVVKTADGNYEMTIELNVGLSTEEAEFAADCYYVKQMKITGDLPSLPTIKKTNVTYVFDENWRVLSFIIRDEYTAMGFPCSSEVHVEFDYAEENAKNDFYSVFKPYEGIESSEITDDAPSAATYLGSAFGSVLTDGGIFKVDLKVDNLDLSGVAYVGMKDKALTDLRVKLSDIGVYMDGAKVLYVTDGVSRYKMDMSALFSPAAAISEEGSGLGLSLDTDALLSQIMNGKFTVGENSTLLETVLDLFGLKVNLAFDFIPGDGGIDLGYVAADIPLGDKHIKANLKFGTDSDIPAKPADISGYTDILTDGLTVDLTAKLDGLDLSGFAHIAMAEGGFKGVYAELGDLSVYYDYPANMLGLSDGNVKYKLGLESLSGGAKSGTDIDLSGILDGIDTKSLLTQIISSFAGADGKISANAALEILGQTVTAALGVQLAGGIKIDADLNAFGKDIALGLGLSEDKVTLPDLSTYTDVLNDGIDLEVAVTLDKLALDGAVHIGFKEGKFDSLAANLDKLGIYYKDGYLYVTDGNAKYKISSEAFNSTQTASFASLNVSSLITEILENLGAGADGVISTGAGFKLLEKAVTAGLNISLNGGIAVDADINIKDLVKPEEGKELDLTAKVHAKLAENGAAFPDDLDKYVDILNGGIALDAKITLDKADIDGKITVRLSDGKLNAVIAELGEIRIDYEASSKALYIAVGSTKAFVNMSQMTYGTADMGATFGAELSPVFGEETSKLICDLLANLSAGLREISTNADISVLDCVIPANLYITLPDKDNGLKIGGDVTLFGIGIKLSAGLCAEPSGLLSEEDREAYVDALKAPFDLVTQATGGRISAEVSGMLYDDSSKYDGANGEKYSFEALLEYDDGSNYEPVLDEEGNPVSKCNPLYLHVNIGLTAMSTNDDSLYLDLILMDAEPSGTDDSGKTKGGYTTDGILDVYLSVSNGKGKQTPLKIYAGMDEILSLVAMVGAAADLQNIKIDGSEELTSAIKSVSGVLEGIIEKYIPNRDQFSSLGDSLIRQILKKDLGTFISDLLAPLFNNNIEPTADGDDIPPEGEPDTKEPVTDKEEKSLDLNAHYIKSVAYANDGKDLNVILDSSILYGAENLGDMKITLSRDILDGGVSRLAGAELNNVYFGEENVNKLNLKLLLSYNDIVKSSAKDGLSGYLDTKGIDTLILSLVNSASKVSGTTTDDKGNVKNSYELCHEYLLSGDIQADLLSIVTIDLNVETLKVIIKEDNSVYADVYLTYSYGLGKLQYPGELYLSIMNDMMFIKRIRENKTELRIMPFNAFFADVLNQAGWMFDLPDWIMGIIKSKVKDGGSANGVQFKDKDYGELLDYVIPKYKYSFDENEKTATWDINIGNNMLTDLAGITFKPVPVKFKATKDADSGAFTVTELHILQTAINFGIDLNLSANFTFQNPHEQITDSSFSDSSQDLINGYNVLTGEIYSAEDVKEGNTENTWHKILGGESFEDICKVTDWDSLPNSIETTDSDGKTVIHHYIDYKSPLAVKTLVYRHANDNENSEFTEFGERVTVLYNTSTQTVYTKVTAPVLPTDKNVPGSRLDWTDRYTVDGDLVIRLAEFKNTYVVTVESEFELDGFTYDGESGVYKMTEPEAYKTILLKKDIVRESGNATYSLLGYKLKGSDALLSFETSTDADGDACFIAPVTGPAEYVAVWEFSYVINFVVLDGEEEIYREPVHYYAGEMLSAKLPAVPEKKGYTGKWVYEDTEVSPDKELSDVYAEYTINKYTVTLVSDHEIEGYTQAEDGTYTLAITQDYGTEINLDYSVTPKSDYGFMFKEYQDASGKKVEKVTVGDENVQYSVIWTGKTITVNYRSDIEFKGSTALSDGYYSVSRKLKYGNKDDTLLGVGETADLFLGWFFEETVGETISYKYTADAEAVKSVAEYLLKDKDTVEITLWAVYFNSTIEGKIDTATLRKKIMNYWSVTGHINVPFSGKSLEIANNSAEISVKYQVKYYISKNGTSGSREYGGMNFSTIDQANIDNEKAYFELIDKMSSYGDSYGNYVGVQAKVSISLNGVQKSNYEEIGIYDLYTKV